MLHVPLENPQYHRTRILSKSVTLELLGEMIFTSLYNHDLEHDSSMEDMHSSQLCRIIAKKYFEIRLYNHGMFYNENVIKERLKFDNSRISWY